MHGGQRRCPVLSYFSESRRLTGPGVRLAVSLLSLLGLRYLCSNAQLFLVCAEL